MKTFFACSYGATGSSNPVSTRSGALNASLLSPSPSELLATEPREPSHNQRGESPLLPTRCFFGYILAINEKGLLTFVPPLWIRVFDCCS